jgi:AAA domain-containing protein
MPTIKRPHFGVGCAADSCSSRTFLALLALKRSISTDSLLYRNRSRSACVANPSKLFQAVPENARIILLGDKDQLTSVEAGYILGDICNTGMVIQLSKEFGRLYTASTGETLPVKMRPRENVMQDSIVELQRNTGLRATVAFSS